MSDEVGDKLDCVSAYSYLSAPDRATYLAIKRMFAANYSPNIRHKT